jgi:hypothetical protein
MQEKLAIIGMWCGAGSKLLQNVHDWPMLKLTYKRAAHAAHLLLPFGKEFDAIEPEVKCIGAVRRCHRDDRIAMRDLVCRFRSDIGVLIDGAACLIDEEEVSLAMSFALNGERYETSRVVARSRSDWLQFQDEGQFAPKVEDHYQQARTRLRPGDLLERYVSIKAREG